MKPDKSPWWFCCGWWSPWCVIDTVLHELHIEWHWVCDKHDAAITGESHNYDHQPVDYRPEREL